VDQDRYAANKSYYSYG